MTNAVNLAAVGSIATSNGTIPITSGTVNAGGTNPFPSSGGPTAVDFTGIPSWVKRITIMFNGVSSSNAAIFGLVQIGSGSVTNSGYVCTMISTVPTATVAASTFTAGFGFYNFGNAADTVNGIIVLASLGSNVWVASGALTETNSTRGITTAGNITLSGVLDRVRITNSDGIATFDAGSINILYE